MLLQDDLTKPVIGLRKYFTFQRVSFVFVAGATSLRNSSNHLSAATNGKKRPISPEQVLRLFGQGGAAALGKALPPSHPPPVPAPLPARRHSPASSPSSTTHHVSP